MTILKEVNFAGVIGTPYAGDTVYTPAGTTQVVAGLYGKHVQLSPAAYLDLTTALTGTTGPVAIDMVINIPAAYTTKSQIAQFRSSSGSLALAQIRTDMKLALNQTSGTDLRASSTVLPTGQDIRIRLILNGTSLSAQIFLDPSSLTPTETMAAVTVTGGTITGCRIGNPTSVTGATFIVGWPRIDDGTDPGPRRYMWVELDRSTFVAPHAFTATVHSVGWPDVSGKAKRYTVDWGDGTTTGPQASNVHTHTTTATGFRDVTPSGDYVDA